jgi:hypothetical protein
MIPRYSVIQYVRNKKRIPYGVIVAIKNNDGGFNIGYSLCNKKDRFTKKMALEIAIGRAEIISPSYTASNAIWISTSDGVNYDTNRPHEIKKMIDGFVERCKKYYK